MAVGNHYNDLTILRNKKGDIKHSIEVKHSDIRYSFKKDSKKGHQKKATKYWIVSFWEWESSTPSYKTLKAIKRKIKNGKNIIIHGTHWNNNKIEKLKNNAEKLNFTVETSNISKSKWKLSLIYEQKHKPVLDIVDYRKN